MEIMKSLSDFASGGGFVYRAHGMGDNRRAKAPYALGSQRQGCPSRDEIGRKPDAREKTGGQNPELANRNYIEVRVWADEFAIQNEVQYCPNPARYIS